MKTESSSGSLRLDVLVVRIAVLAVTAAGRKRNPTLLTETGHEGELGGL